MGSATAYEAYARNYIYNIDVPGCAAGGRVFVAQRQEGFHISLGKIFDLINLVPVPGLNVSTAECRAKNDDTKNLNVGSFVLELPISCVKGPSSDVIGAWATTRQLIHSGGGHTPGLQVSRLGNPLVNELFIGLKDKNTFNMVTPPSDGQFVSYVTNPTFPAIIDILFRAPLGAAGNIAPSNIPRSDLVATFLTGLAGINQYPGGVACEYLRLNLTIPPTPQAAQSQFGIIGGDSAGFPNGRRPGDDVVDIALRVAMGRLCYIAGLGFCTAAQAPVGNVDLTDGSPMSAADFNSTFPYMTTPNPGAVTDPNPTFCPSASTPCPVCHSGAVGLVSSVFFILFFSVLLC